MEHRLLSPNDGGHHVPQHLSGRKACRALTCMSDTSCMTCIQVDRATQPKYGELVPEVLRGEPTSQGCIPPDAPLLDLRRRPCGVEDAAANRYSAYEQQHGGGGDFEAREAADADLRSSTEGGEDAEDAEDAEVQQLHAASEHQPVRGVASGGANGGAAVDYKISFFTSWRLGAGTAAKVMAAAPASANSMVGCRPCICKTAANCLLVFAFL